MQAMNSAKRNNDPLAAPGNHRQSKSGFISRTGWATVIVLTIGLTALFFLLEAPPLVVLVQITLGVPLWFWCFDKALHLRHRVGWLWVLLLAPLFRQMFWVTVPSIAFYVLPLRPGYTPLINALLTLDIGAGAVVMLIGNYVLFATMWIGLRLQNLHAIRDAPFSSYKSPWYLFLTGIVLSLVWVYFRLGDQTAELVTLQDRFGSSLTVGWGYTGLLLVLLAFWPSRAGISVKQIVIWSAVIGLWVLPLITVGSRVLVIYPFVILFSLVIILIANRIRWHHIILYTAGALPILYVVFLIVGSVRAQYYWTGQNAPFSELPSLLLLAMNQDSTPVLAEVNTRLNSMLVNVQLAVTQPDLFPARNISHIIAGFVASFDTRFARWSQLLGLDPTMNGFDPGQYVMYVLYGGESTASYPPEMEFYLSGNIFGLLFGYITLGFIAVAWIWVFRALKLLPVTIMALCIGTLFTEFLIAELYSRVLLVITWRMFVLVLLLKGVEVLFALIKRLSNPGIRRSIYRATGN